MILGGSEGIGAAFARQAASHGLNVVLAARQPEPLEHDRVVHRIRDRHRSLRADDRR
jgi:short-subunit dehydrogenase